MKTHRLARVAEVVREVAAETILFEVRDPRVKNVTVTRAEVAADLQHAKVFVSVMGSEKEQALAMHGLKNAAGFVQSKLAKRLETRFLPVIIFVVDEGVKKSVEVARLLREEQEKHGTFTPKPDESSPDGDPDGADTDDDPDNDDEDDESDGRTTAGGQDAPGKPPGPETPR